MRRSSKREIGSALKLRCKNNDFFYSIDRAALWLLLRSQTLYTKTVSCVRVDGDESGWFGMNSGVRQGCTLAPNVFLAPMDWTMSRTDLDCATHKPISNMRTTSHSLLKCWRFILPVLLYGADIWSLTAVLSRKLDAFDQWSLRRILGIHYSQHISNENVRKETNHPLVTGTICARRLQLFGHIAWASEAQDHSRVVRCAINKLGGNVVLEDQETPSSAQLNKTLNHWTSASIPRGETFRTVISGASVLPELRFSLGHADERWTNERDQLRWGKYKL